MRENRRRELRVTRSAARRHGRDRPDPGKPAKPANPGESAKSRESAKSAKSAKSARHAPSAPVASDNSLGNSLSERGTAWTIGALLVLTPFVVLPSAKESFRLGQGLLGGWLGLLSLAIAALSLPSAGPTSLGALWRRPAIRALAPLTIVVAVGGLVTRHPAHFHAAFADFSIGVACIVGWSLALGERTLRRLLFWTIPTAVLVALLGLDQFAGWFGTLDWLHVDAPTARLRLTSTVGNPGDLAALLVLPVLVALDRWRWRTSTPRARVALAAAILVLLIAIAITATFAPAIALAVGAIVWWLLSSHPRGLRAPLLVAFALLIVVAGSVALTPPLRTRVVEKTAQLAHGDLNALLTGRLDGWRAAWAMLWRSPATGVGQGAFRAEFADTRLALEAQGVPFYAEQQQVILATPHNEALSVAAEQGLPGLLALGWAITTLCVAARRVRDANSRALVWAGIAALAMLSLVSFPLHVASIAWPWLLFLAWVFRRSEEAL